MNKIKEILNNLLDSFKTNSGGYSARKISAFVIIVMVVSLHIKWFQSDKWEYVGEILALDFAFVSVALGMTTYEAIKKNSQAKE
jgi:hypothetical protein